MNDNYSHNDFHTMYVVENIPGPRDESDECKELISNFHSQLTEHCICENVCVQSKCNCLTRCGKVNYISTEDSKLLLKDVLPVESLSIIECNSLCNCYIHCGNRLVQRGPILGLFVKVCDEKFKGKGLFTTHFISRGSFICEYAGEVITRKEAERRHDANLLQNKMNYILCLNEHCNNSVIQTIVDPSGFGNIGRYINHSCEPNCCIVPVRVDTPIPKLAIFSCVDIFPNTEITFDYGSYSKKQSTLGKKRIKCYCGTQKCKGLLPYENY